MFSAVRVISLPTQPARLAEFNAKFPAKEWLSAGFPEPQWFSAYDFRGGLPPGARFIGPKSAYGCLTSHLRIIQEAVWANADKPVCIFEDDCQFVDNAIPTLIRAMNECPKDADMLYLGGQHIRHPEPMDGQGLVLCQQTARTHAYIVYPRFFKRFIDEVQQWPDHIDHCFEFLSQSDPSIHFYGIDPWIAFQRENFSSITNEAEPARSWDRRVATAQRDPDMVPIVFLESPREAFERLIRIGLAWGGGWRDKETGIDNQLGLAARMPDVDDQATEIKKWIARNLPAAATRSQASLTIWAPGIQQQAVRLATDCQYIPVHAEDVFEAAAAWPETNGHVDRQRNA